MEDTLRDKADYKASVELLSLNPCFNGRYSQRRARLIFTFNANVLILVLMEDTLREKLWCLQ